MMLSSVKNSCKPTRWSWSDQIAHDFKEAWVMSFLNMVGVPESRATNLGPAAMTPEPAELPVRRACIRDGTGHSPGLVVIATSACPEWVDRS